MSIDEVKFNQPAPEESGGGLSEAERLLYTQIARVPVDPHRIPKEWLDDDDETDEDDDEDIMLLGEVVG